MRHQDVHWLLTRLMAFQLSAADYGWSHISMIHKMMEGTASSSGKAGHKILAPDMPVELRRAQKALNALPESDQQIVRVKLMPYIIDDREATEAERARFVGRGIRPFQQRYIQILGKLNRIMKEINATD